MYPQRNNNKYLLYTFVFLAFSLLLVALFSLYFSQQTVAAKKKELLLEQEYLNLRQKIARKEKEYRTIVDNIEEIREEIGEGGQTRQENIDTILKKTTPRIKKMVLENIPVGYPCRSRRVTSKFGYRMHPIYHEERFHHGIDFGGKEGTPVVTTADGIIEYAGFSKGGYGNVVIISHNYGFKTLYGHMRSNLAVKKGDFVKKGTVIGYLGNSGLSTGPHLHYEIKYLRHYIDPHTFLRADADHFATMLKNTPQISWQNLISAISNAYRKFTSL